MSAVRDVLAEMGLVAEDVPSAVLDVLEAVGPTRREDDPPAEVDAPTVAGGLDPDGPAPRRPLDRKIIDDALRPPWKD